MPCLGLSVQYNSFKNNFGCPKYGGSVIALECVSNLTTNTVTGESIDYDEVDGNEFNATNINNYSDFDYR